MFNKRSLTTNHSFVELRDLAGCNKNPYHVKVLQNCADCDGCLYIISEFYMRKFGIKSHVDFGEID